MISIKEYVEHLINVRNQFFSVNNNEAAFMVQKDIDKLITAERNEIFND